MDEENWKEYSVIVHAIKSSSRMTGAAELSELAADLEKAADSGDVYRIKDETGRLLEQYRTACDAIREVLPEAEASSKDEDDDMILEFMPVDENGE